MARTQNSKNRSTPGSGQKPQTIAQNPNQPNRMFILGIVGVVVIGLGLVALLATNRGDGESTAAAASQTADVTLEGDVLAPLPSGVAIGTPENDPINGQVAPTLTGTRFDGTEVTIGPDGTPKAVYFLAHWCPHCQDEVPVIQELIDSGQLPDNLDIYGVSTSVDRGRGNFPPEEWFEEESFTPTVIRDDDASSAIASYGGSSFPYVVFLDGENRVVARASGNLPADTIAELWNLTAASG